MPTQHQIARAVAESHLFSDTPFFTIPPNYKATHEVICGKGFGIIWFIDRVIVGFYGSTVIPINRITGESAA